MFEDLEGRIDRLVEGLLRGKRLRARVADAAQREAIMAAAELAAAREGYPRMSPAFRRKLADTLRAGRTPGLVNRRTALGAVAGLAAGAVGAAALSRLPAGPGAPPAPGVASGVMQPAGGRWIEVALLSQLSEAAPTRVVAGESMAYLFRQGDRVTGVSAVCTHWPCALNWQAANSTLNCPCHNLNFEPDGDSANSDYQAPPLPSFQVKVENGRVSIFTV
jgi:nitrite reductase/ring-hydroxylating ferredoxin subunit